MRLLAVDTALGACSVAVLEDGAARAHRLVPMLRGHAEALAPMVDEAMREAGLAFSSLDRLAVTTGPGTFTGQRVGLAFMRGLRLALRRPLVGVTTLDAMAAAAGAESGLSTVAVLHEAKRGEVYATLVAGGKTALPVQIAEFGAMMSAIATAAGAQMAGFAGTAAEAAAIWYRDHGSEAVLTTVRQPDALWVARLAAAAPEPSGAPKPLYLRAPDAKLPQPRLRAADRRDIAALAVLHALCFAKAWSVQSFQDLLAAPGVFGFLVEQGGKAIGFALGRVAADEAELLSIGVLEPQRCSGVGRRLLMATAARAAELGAANLYLEVSRDNQAARRLYDRLGFRQVGARSGYYRKDGADSQDALVLRAALPISGLGNDPKVD